MRVFASIDALTAELEARGCMLFGSGFVAEMFMKGLVARGLGEVVSGCMASNPRSDERFHGMVVQRLADVSAAEVDLVCVAVHESSLDVVGAALAEAGFADVAWVYPQLHDLMCGKPIVCDARISLPCILHAQNPDSHWLAVRAMAAKAIEDGESDADAIDAYVKAQAAHCSTATAEKRLQQLRGLVRSFREDGFDSAHPVLLDTNLNIIDGLHRIALAWLAGLDAVPCNLVASNGAFAQLFDDRNMLTSAILSELDLSPGQREAIGKLNECMLAGASPVPSISIIVPVYNVEDYIDTCMETLVGQTFGDFEVLLIDDGSTDGSGARCEQWASRDARVQFVRKANGGVSSCRNLGIQMARGTYLAFVDPDDWLDARYLEKLHAVAERDGSLYVECDLWRYDNRTGKKIHRASGRRTGVPYTLEEHMKYGPTASYKALSRRSLWVDNDVRFPDCNFESPAVYALVLALAGDRNSYVPEPLYYYRRFRANSLVETAYAKEQGVADNTLGIQAMAHLMAQFRARGLYERFARQMPGLVAYRLNDILAMQYHRRSEQDFRELVANQRAFLETAFPDLPMGPYLTWGGYNLNRIMQHLPMLNDPSCRFNFSSIVSVALGEGDESSEAQHANRYRQMMVTREIRQDVWRIARDVQPRYVFMDFIDDRFDLLESEGRYLTASDAYDGANVPLPVGRRIAFGSEEHQALWEGAFTRFVERLRTAAPHVQLVIVENYLSESVGTLERKAEYPQVESIRATNRVLAQMYAFARQALPDAIVVPAYQCADYFTDEAYEYGAVPSHLNEIVNQRIAEAIEEAVFL